MNMDLMLTLGTLVVVIIMFLSGKANFGFIGMCCAAFMCASGVLTFDEAYENFASNNIIMMCGMFVLAGALNKTSLVNKVRDFIMSRNASGRTIVFLYLAGVILLTQLVSPLGVISMMAFKRGSGRRQPCYDLSASVSRLGRFPRFPVFDSSGCRINLLCYSKRSSGGKWSRSVPDRFI